MSRLSAAAAAGFAMTLACVAPSAAQSRVFTEVDTTRVTVGDRITMRISVEHASDSRVEWPDSLDLSPFETIEFRPEPAAAAEGRVRSTAVLVLTAFQLGELEIPEVPLTVVAADGERESLSTEPYGIEVRSVGADPSGDIRDIRGPLAIPSNVVRLALWLLLPLLLAAILYAGARRLRSTGSVEDTSRRAAPARPPHELALEALAALEASPLLGRGEVKEYHIEVSDILRTYVERRFRVPALEMTTREVLAGLERAEVDEALRKGLRPFLDQCDLVKFARVRPADDACRQVLELGRRLVLSSAPQPLSARGPGEGASDGSGIVEEGRPEASSGPQPEVEHAATKVEG